MIKSISICVYIILVLILTKPLGLTPHTALILNAGIVFSLFYLLIETYKETLE